MTATDQAGSGRSSTSKVHIQVKDANDNIPRFVSPLTFSTTSNASIGDKVGHVTATDDDITQPNNHVVYILRQGGYGKFMVHYDTGRSIMVVSSIT